MHITFACTAVALSAKCARTSMTRTGLMRKGLWVVDALQRGTEGGGGGADRQKRECNRSRQKGNTW
jgi:hypothetical protein